MALQANPGRRQSALGLVIALTTLGSGLLNVYSVIGPSLPERYTILRAVFPFEFLHLSRFVTPLVGFTLVILSINIYKRKKRAALGVIALSGLSIVFHLTKGLDYEEALFSLVLLLALVFTRKEFTVRSGAPNFAEALMKLSVGVGITLSYGVLGFWLLDRSQFGIDFSFAQSMLNTGSLLLLSPRPDLVPHTAYARWFLESFYFITLTASAYAGIALFRPVVYRYRIQPHEQELARQILQQNGRASLDTSRCGLISPTSFRQANTLS